MRQQNPAQKSASNAQGLWWLCGLLFLSFLLSRVGGLLGAALGAANMPVLTYLAPPLFSYLIPFFLYFYFLRGTDSDFCSLPLLRGGRDALPLLPFFVASVVACAYASSAMMGALGLPVTGGGVRGDGFFSDLFTNALFPALFEELFFRGAILSLLYRRQGTAAVWVAAVLFAFAHTSLYQLPYAFVGGVFLSLVTVVGGSWVWAFVFHFGNNLLSLSLQYAENLPASAWVIATLLYALVAIGAIISAVYLLCHRDAPARVGLCSLFAAPREDGTRVLRTTLLSPLVLYLLWMLYLIIVRCL